MPTRSCPLLPARIWRRVASSFGMLVVAALLYGTVPAARATIPVGQRIDGAGPDRGLVVAAGVSPQQCEALALARPINLTGGYVGGFVLNNNNYEIRFIGRAMPKACNGTRTVKLFQQKQELGVGLHPKLEWIHNGFRPDRVSKQGGREQVVMRAARLCWPLSIGGGGDGDKRHHIKARPAAVVTWTPTGGQSVSKTLTGIARVVCR